MQAVITILAALVAGGHGFGFNPQGQFAQQAPFGGGYGGYGAGGGYGGYGYSQPQRPQGKPEKPMQLSCVGTHDGGYGKDAIAANIQEKRSGYGGGQGALFGSPFSQLNFGGSFGGSFGQQGSGGLEAVFELVSNSFKGGKVTLIVTEKAYSAGGCYVDNFGLGLSAHKGQGGQSAFGSGYGGGAGFGGGVGAFGGGGFGFASPHQFFDGKGGYGPEQYYPDGVLTEVDLKYGTPKVISLDRLKDFTNLKQLAGRGLIACAGGVESDYHNRAKCVGTILACCSLAYDHEDRTIASAGY